MRVLVTGAAGFVGSTICDALVARGDEVIGLDLLLPAAHSAGRPRWAPANLVVGDVRDHDTVDALLPGVDVVCHQAAMVGLGVDLDDLPEYMSHNVVGTSVLLSAMARAGVKRLVQASSMVVYGNGAYDCPTDGPMQPVARDEYGLAAGVFDLPCPECAEPLDWRAIDESAPFDPQNGYAISKVAQEGLAGTWARQTQGAGISLRYHNIYGPRMPRDTPYAGVAAIFRSALEVGRAPKVFEDGEQMRDFVHVGDVAAANLAAIDLVMDGSAGHSAVNVASGQPHTVGEFARELSRAMNGPLPEVVGGGRPGDVRHIVADPARARSLLGFTARVGFADGVAEFATAPLRAPASHQFSPTR